MSPHWARAGTVWAEVPHAGPVAAAALVQCGLSRAFADISRTGPA